MGINVLGIIPYTLPGILLGAAILMIFIGREYARQREYVFAGFVVAGALLTAMLAVGMFSYFWLRNG